MGTVLKNALLMAALLTAAHQAAAVDELVAPSRPAVNHTIQALWADTAITPQTPPDPAAISAIPEPPVYIMLLVGVGLVGLVARRQPIPPAFSVDQE